MDPIRAAWMSAIRFVEWMAKGAPPQAEMVARAKEQRAAYEKQAFEAANQANAALRRCRVVNVRARETA